jgi:hypothetical protein
LLLLCTLLSPLDIDGAVFLRSFVQSLHLSASLDSTGVTPLLRYYEGSVTSRVPSFGSSTDHERCSLSRVVIPDSYRSKDSYRKHRGSRLEYAHLIRTSNMQSLQKEYTAKGVIWLSIDSSAPGEQGNYPAEKLNQIASNDGAARTALLLDPNGKVGRLYGAKTTPDMYIIDPKGTLVYEGAIDNKQSTDLADVKTATNYVKTALDAVMTGKTVPTTATRPYGCSVKYASN